ncbi:GCN5-related N-acetyltransferase [Kribbella flavida DSM 17836]|uniref:GCN5-related N-acetyltransferase n=1 Tax=Kribbella flavida (strain DSM 17836 / JCM 10339 / NBRC 14399) TaxID=479435 RepID=D2PTC6_KRIFD|nr:GNAT family N-acetyltransferase [Kribbella flavida]ADB29442.1 GCN5-related N-acetyltransferase [Kribbella flavida DSM 17836]
MRELLTPAELVEAAEGDLIPVWAGQGRLGADVRAWYAEGAVAVAAPDLSRRDRLAVAGPVDALAPLVEQVLEIVGPGFRPFGEEPLIRGLTERVPGLSFRAAFGWMETDAAPAETTTARWLPDDRGVAELLDEASPTSYAWPGSTGVRRWAAIADDRDALVSVAADAWSAPEVGFLAGVATRPVARGRGLSRQVCAFVTAELVKQHGRAALMVDAENAAAIAVYQRLGYRYRPVAAAHHA